MSWLWPGFLLLLGSIPILMAVYIVALRRRRRFAVRYSSLSLLRLAMPQHSFLRRHLPFGLFLLALASLVLAVGRPVTTVNVPSGQNNVILTIDVSRSMCSTDIPPNRMVAAQAAALSFIQDQGALTQIGVVAFAGFSELIQLPTGDQEMLQTAIESLTPARRTAIGSGILQALNAIAEVNPSVAPSDDHLPPGERPAPRPEGDYVPDIIVLLSDGASNSGPYPLDAAQQAVDRGVRVFTIGYGTESGSIMDCSPETPGGERFGFGGGFGGGSGFGGFRRGIDEVTLKRIAEMTGGAYYSASSASELQDVFDDLPSHFATRKENMEISVGFVAIGALLAALAILLSLIWHPLL